MFCSRFTFSNERSKNILKLMNFYITPQSKDHWYKILMNCTQDFDFTMNPDPKAIAMAYSSVKRLSEVSQGPLAAACASFLDSLDREVDVDASLTRKRKRKSTRFLSVKQLKQKLQYQVRKRRAEKANLNQELPDKGVHNRLQHIWLIRAGLAEATVPSKTLQQLLCEFSLTERKAISTWSIFRARDAFAELVKATNRHLIRRTFDSAGCPASVCITHVHDGCDLRFRSMSDVQMSDLDVELPADALRMSRSRMSKVQTSSVVVHIGSNSIPFFTELQALKKKDADTIASALIGVLCELLTTILGDEAPAVPLQVLHVVTGDGINTNAAALKRVYRFMAKTWSKKDWILYRLLNWKCSSHKANLVAQHVVCDGQRDSLLRANCSRLYKYIMPAYADEIGHNLRTYVVEKLVVDGGEVPALDRRSDYFLLQLYGSQILPATLQRLLNMDVRQLRHKGMPADSLPFLRGSLFSELYKLVCLVETKPVVTRFWTFSHCIFALTRCKLCNLPDYVFSTGAVQPRPENERRLTRFRSWWQESETDKHLRAVSLCLRLTKLTVDIASQKPVDDSQDPDRKTPTMVRLGKQVIEHATAKQLLEILRHLHHDPALNVTWYHQALYVG